jgi:uncharacterized membrane protein YbhN (UPF0104 family)
MPEEDQSVIAEPGEASLVADPEPLSSGVSPHRLRRGFLRLGGLVAIVVVVVTLAPGLGELRRRFAQAQRVWIVIACLFEVLSVLSYVPAFRAVFCTRMSWGTSCKIGVAEEGAGSLFPLGGAGSLALGVGALRRGGIPVNEIARATVAFFLLTGAPSVVMLFLLGAELSVGILPGGGGLLLTVVPGIVAARAIAGALALRRLARRAEARVRRQGEQSRWLRLAPLLSATSAGVQEAIAQLRRADPLLLVGLVGALVLYGVPAVTATAGVLLYRVIEPWIPAVLGIAAFAQLRLLLMKETAAIKMRQRGETIEIVGLGPATIDRA